MADLALQRKNMVESQVRPSDVTDRRIMTAMLQVPREAFLPASMATLAYGDGEVRLVPPTHASAGRALMSPRTFARLIDLARLKPGEVALDVGAATGYSSAVLARLVDTVVALESDAALAAKASKTLADLSQDNVAVVQGELAKGWPSAGPFDAIILEGAVSEVPAALLDQLKVGGRLVGVLADGVGSAVVWQATEGGVHARTAFEAPAPLLPGFERKVEFAF